ncbi:LysR family transcriptional regulator [Paraburkholderia aspalathi]|uniref:LysR family transcriptional regulator n=1 Tax=Paraburkholderia TaxID=1822464 RepID=UPI00225A57A4|nr:MULTISPECIES: LysR family transcriptional regulator [Paraburkholderia]MCX4159649.1 LysR family transcriptional regulator [Paraburkholderia aspalathi]MDN7169047.1 LysR family transcriptional regulator [Paraburkholderia sp. SECH2]MDQ6397534.1 LysR family transcriptional regulator [Paraburkholderia aspalathi]
MISSERLNAIRAFVQAADAGSFTRAATQLGLSKSAVGKAIARLEERLNVRLFHRTTRSISLTDEGKTFYTSCIRALSELEAAEASLAARSVVPSGRLRVSLPSMFGPRWVMPVLLELAVRHEQLELEATFVNRRVDFAEEGIDLAVRIGELEEGSHLTARVLGTQKLVVCAAPAYFATHGRPASIESLNHHTCISLLRDGKVESWRFKGKSGETRFVAVQARLRIGHLEAISAATLSWHGIAQIPLWLVSDALRAGALQATLTEMEAPGLPIHVVWPAGRMMPPRVDSVKQHGRSATTILAGQDNCRRPRIAFRTASEPSSLITRFMLYASTCKLIYMNASRLSKLSYVLGNRLIAALYPGLLQPDPLRPTMKSADPCLILRASSKLV